MVFPSQTKPESIIHVHVPTYYYYPCTIHVHVPHIIIHVHVQYMYMKLCCLIIIMFVIYFYYVYSSVLEQSSVKDVFTESTPKTRYLPVHTNTATYQETDHCADRSSSSLSCSTIDKYKKEKENTLAIELLPVYIVYLLVY